MVMLHFRGIFGQLKELFSGKFEHKLNIFFFLVNFEVSGGVSIQMPFFEA
jgi:hypothetical protein